MAWNDEDKAKAIYLILDCISQGQSLKSIIDERSREEVPAYSTIMLWINEDKTFSENYTRACEERAEKIFEEIIDIADDRANDYTETEDGKTMFNAEHVQRSRLKIDARKWVLSKMNSKRFGDKVDLTTAGEKLPAPIPLQITLPDGTNLDDFKID